MQFLMNNLWFAAISIVVLSFVGFIIVKIVHEVNLNSLLKNKHSAMRINAEPIKTSFVKRIGFLTSTALAPVAVVAIVVTVSISASNMPSGELRDLNNGNEIVDIFNDYNELLGGQVAEEVGEDSVIESDVDPTPTNGPEFDGAYEAKYYVSSTSEIYGADVITENVIIDGFTFQIDATNTNIIQTYSSDALDIPTNQIITFTANTVDLDSCRREEYINGYYVDVDVLTVITTEYSVGCYYEYEGYLSEEEFVLSTTKVNVYVYDREPDLELNTIYEFDGLLLGTYRKNNQLYIATDTNIPYEKDGFILELHVPNYSINIGGSKQSYGITIDDIIYVEGVLPSSFISLYEVDLNENQVEVEMLLIDDSFDLYFEESQIRFVGDIYYFESSSALFTLSDPVDSLKAITFTFDITSELVYETYKVE